MRVYKTGELHVSIKELRKLADELEAQMREHCKNLSWEYTKKCEDTSWIIRIISDCPLFFFHDDTWHLDHRKLKSFESDEEFDKAVLRHIKRLKRTVKYCEKNREKKK